MRRRYKIATGAVAVLAFAGGGVAYAAWTSSGSGTGAAASTHDTPSSISVGGTPAADLFPGAVNVVTVNVSNPNPYPVIVTSLSAGQAPAVNRGSCAAGTVWSDAKAAAAGVTQTDGTTTIAPNGTGTFALVGHMAANAVDACKDQTFALPLTATLDSAA